MAAPQDNTFALRFAGFNIGAGPLAHLDSLTEEGNSGHYSAAENVDVVTNPGVLTQGPALSSLTNGTQAGVVSEKIEHILDIPTSSDVTFGIGATKLFKISSSTVSSGGSPSWPRTITGASGGGGNSTHYFQGFLYYFFNKASGAECGRYDLASSFTDAYFSVTPTGAAALQNAPHPVASKQDIMLFGNGRYVGTFISSGVVLSPTKLDFGVGAECADVAFHANQWWIAINTGVTTGTNRAKGQIYLYDGAALSALLTDEVALGVQQIGFVYPVNGVVYVAYKDLTTTGGFAIGFVNGRQLKPLRYFTGTLPTFAQKTLYLSMILFQSNGSLYTAGARTEQLPYQISQHADGGYATVGAVAAPFGTPMVASTDGGSNFRLAKFSGYDTACTWRSLVIPTIRGRMVGYVDRIIVLTKTLGAGASCALKVEYNQAATQSAAKTITTTGKRRHVFKNIGVNAAEDIRLFLDWSGGSASNACPIRMIIVEGHFVEAT